MQPLQFYNTRLNKSISATVLNVPTTALPAHKAQSVFLECLANLVDVASTGALVPTELRLQHTTKRYLDVLFALKDLKDHPEQQGKQVLKEYLVFPEIQVTLLRQAYLELLDNAGTRDEMVQVEHLGSRVNLDKIRFDISAFLGGKVHQAHPDNADRLDHRDTHHHQALQVHQEPKEKMDRTESLVNQVSLDIQVCVDLLARMQSIVHVRQKMLGSTDTVTRNHQFPQVMLLLRKVGTLANTIKKTSIGREYWPEFSKNNEGCYWPPEQRTSEENLLIITRPTLLFIQFKVEMQMKSDVLLIFDCEKLAIVLTFYLHSQRNSNLNHGPNIY